MPNTAPSLPHTSADHTVPNALHVAVGVVRDSQGRILIAKRPPGVHLAGLWEFPGGKLEAGEGVFQALARELAEELAIHIERARPLLRVRYAYPEHRVLLDVWQIDAYWGRPVGRQGQAIRWAAPEQLPSFEFPAANQPITTAVRLPECYAILDNPPPEPASLHGRLLRLAERGVSLVQLRAKERTPQDYASLAESAIGIAREVGITLLLNAAPSLAERLGADGVHLPAQSLMRLPGRPLPASRWVAASCHDARELAQAERLGVDFAVLGPVRPTASHPLAPPLGWERFAELADRANLPVFALGGLTLLDLDTAQRNGARGIAAIGAFR